MTRTLRATQAILPLYFILHLSERRDDFAETQKDATDGYFPPAV